MGNHILLTTELITIDTRDIMPEETISTLQTIEDLGKQQYKRFVEERILSHQKSIDDTIKRNNISLFNYKTSQKSNKAGYKVLKNDIKLFSQLFIAAQSRGTDLDDFFMYENQPYPTSLAKDGEIRTGIKSELLSCIENLFQSSVIPTETESSSIQKMSTLETCLQSQLFKHMFKM